MSNCASAVCHCPIGRHPSGTTGHGTHSLFRQRFKGGRLERVSQVAVCYFVLVYRLLRSKRFVEMLHRELVDKYRAQKEN